MVLNEGDLLVLSGASAQSCNWTFDNWLTIMTIAASAICDIPCQFPPSKVNGGASRRSQITHVPVLFHLPMLCPWLRRPCPQTPLANYSTCPLNLSTYLHYITGARGTHLPAHPYSVSSAHGTCPPTLSSSEVPADGTCLPARNSIQPVSIFSYIAIT